MPVNDATLQKNQGDPVQGIICGFFAGLWDLKQRIWLILGLKAMPSASLYLSQLHIWWQGWHSFSIFCAQRQDLSHVA